MKLKGKLLFLFIKQLGSIVPVKTSFLDQLEGVQERRGSNGLKQMKKEEEVKLFD